jgi:hypothetical protein
MSTDTQNTAEQPQQAAQLPQFTPDDLVQAVVLIDAACTAGAFKGWEDIQKAFAIRNKLLVFAQMWAETAQQAQTAQQATTEVATEAAATAAPVTETAGA